MKRLGHRQPILIDDDINDDDAERDEFHRRLDLAEELRGSGRLKTVKLKCGIMRKMRTSDRNSSTNTETTITYSNLWTWKEAFDERQVPKFTPKKEARKQPPPRLLLQEFTTETGLKVEKGVVIELDKPIGRWDIRFLKVEAICQNYPTGTVTLRGFPFARARSMRGILPRKLNEVCLIAQIADDDSRPWKEQMLIEVFPGRPWLLASSG